MQVLTGFCKMEPDEHRAYIFLVAQWKKKSHIKNTIVKECKKTALSNLGKYFIYLFFHFILSRHVLVMQFEMLFCYFLLLHLVMIWVSRGWPQSLWVYK